MNGKELVEALADATGFSKKDSKKFLDSFLAVIQENATTGVETSIRGFGTFYPHTTEAYETNHPKTRERITIERCTKLKFKASKPNRSL